MAQYYRAVILGEAPRGAKGREIIRLWSCPHDYGYGAKLMEHSYFHIHFVLNLEYQLSPDGIFYKSRVVWAGDYALKEPPKEDGTSDNLYHLCENNSTHMPLPHRNTSAYPYLVNHTKMQYVDKTKEHIHPLPLLTAEGNGSGGGDYGGHNEDLCGAWARHVISIEKEPPVDYKELLCGFEEY